MPVGGLVGPITDGAAFCQLACRDTFSFFGGRTDSGLYKGDRR